MSDVQREARWAEADPELPSELVELLREGRESLGRPDEVSELAGRLAAVLGPGAGLPGSELPVDPASPELAGRGPGPAVRSPASGARRAGLASANRGLLAIGGAAVTVGAAAFLFLRGAPVPVSAPPRLPSPAEARSIPEPAQPAEPALAAPPADTPEPPSGPERATGAIETRPLAAPRTAARAARARRPQGDGASETALLEQARAALQQRPAEALELTRRHEARFSHGALVQEREVIAIEALERLGRRAAAKARAAEFERRYRGSVHQPRLLRGSDTSVPSGGSSSTSKP